MTRREGPRGRPRGFDVEAAVVVAQRLFQERGYDGVGVAALTEALDINPPSFYAAFGSKAALFERVLDRYEAARLPRGAYLRQGTPPAKALGAYLEAAARIYAEDAATGGCLILESARGLCHAESTEAARRRKRASHDAVADFVHGACPDRAETVADFVMAVSTGMSAAAREGVGERRLRALADVAAVAIETMLR